MDPDRKDEFEKLSEKAYILIDKFDKMEIPSRLDRIDSKSESKISSISSEVQALQSRIEMGDKNLNSEIKALHKNIASEVYDSRNKIFSRLEKQSKDIKLIYFSILGAFALALIVVVLFYLKII